MGDRRGHRSAARRRENEGLPVPATYVEFLKMRNGTSFGANVPNDEPFRRLDLVA
jgi:hypothetical protein